MSATPLPDYFRRCTQCVHLTRYRNCVQPIEAGLIPAAAGFGLAWPGPLQAVSCPAFAVRTQAGAAHE